MNQDLKFQDSFCWVQSQCNSRLLAPRRVGVSGDNCFPPSPLHWSDVTPRVGCIITSFSDATLKKGAADASSWHRWVCGIARCGAGAVFCEGSPLPLPGGRPQGRCPWTGQKPLPGSFSSAPCVAPGPLPRKELLLRFLPGVWAP